MNDEAMNPAEKAAAEAQARVTACLKEGRNFRLEAGAGAGKTYSLVEALKLLIKERGGEMLRQGQKIACITYTEVARDEIVKDIEEHPAILVDTIHAFSWRLLSPFQKALRKCLTDMPDRQDKIAEGGGIGSKRIEYQFGFFGVEDDKVTLSHDDIPRFMAQLLAEKKFQSFLTQQHPIIFIDEYQDTDKGFMEALTNHFLRPKSGPLIGLFGDHWQTIYRGDFSLADFPNVEGIDKGSNFRSAPIIVDALNVLRPELKQAVSDPAAHGEVSFFHTNSYKGERTSTAHSKEDLPDGISQQYTSALKANLTNAGWQFTADKTKILMLTHNALAAEQGYPTIATIFDRNEAFAKKEDALIEFLADELEPICRAYCAKRFGEMFRLLKTGPDLTCHDDKLLWRKDMDALLELRKIGTVGDVIDHLKKTNRPHLADKIIRREDDLARIGPVPVADEPRTVTRHRNIRPVAYTEIMALTKYLDGETAFATQHSVKGAQFDNVLVVLGGGWNHYKWPQLLELLETNAINSKNTGGFHRARNLFYVAISRPKKRLAIICTQTLSNDALAAAKRTFGEANVHELEV
ncbi:DNA helicase-2/ATP-dependent DNA helicase PcrA [Rhizobium sp. BK226]|uniref:UvrD-helicase domain-containing protein n=1 Tax=Rhizobium sp. BK226 TaxID=2587075 RepID=UPI0016124BB3|nr:UvrD-helicase domain-containing protein [Rhizobium sp. BK226]MBB4116417.1 DNA helicase-2/ATP-dependent DNA helicase PcrA [Rhizobium sp. BK226]